jgi:hypothetical protein
MSLTTVMQCERDPNIIHVHVAKIGGDRLTIAEIKKAYEGCEDIRVWAEQLRISPTLARKICKLAGVDYLKDAYRAFRSGGTLKQVGKIIGIKPQDLSNKFKDKGYSVARGRKRPPMSQAEISKAVAQNAPIPSIAQRFDIRWQTAKKVLMELNLLANAKERVPFERYKVNETELYKLIGSSIDHHSSRYLS